MPRARRRLAYFRVALSVLATLTLVACQVDAVVTLDVGQNGAGTLSLSVLADKEVVAQTPKLTTDLRFADAVAAGWVVSGPNATADGGMQASLSHTFDNDVQATVLLSQLSGVFGPFKQMTFTRTGKDTDSTYKLDGALQVDGGLDAFADPALLKIIGGSPFVQSLENAEMDLGKAMTIDFVAIIPGTIQQTTGSAIGNTFKWRVPLDGSKQSVTTTTQNTAVKATVSRVVAGLFKLLLALWLIAMVVVIVKVAYNRRGSLRTPNE